jgi:hypothetical protein
MRSLQSLALRSSLPYEPVVNFFKIDSGQMFLARMILFPYVYRVAFRNEIVGCPKEKKECVENFGGEYSCNM